MNLVSNRNNACTNTNTPVADIRKIDRPGLKIKELLYVCILKLRADENSKLGMKNIIRFDTVEYLLNTNLYSRIVFNPLLGSL